MKHLLLAVLLLPCVVAAQSPQPIPIRQVVRGSQVPADVLPDNYQVTLTITDKDGQPLEVSVVIASTQFSASLGDQNLTFSGSVTVEEAGGIIIAYALGWDTPASIVGGSQQYRASSTQGSVRLKLGEEVQIIRAGSRIARLSIKKLEPSKPK